MSRDNQNHLSEETLNDVLIGLGSAEAQDHIARCAGCRARVEQFEAGVNLFNEASLAWSMAQPAGAPHAPSPYLRVRRRLALVAWAAVAVMFLAIGVPFLRHPIQIHISGIAPAPVESDAQIAEDNELMRAVNAAISPDVQPDVQSVVNDEQILESEPPTESQKSRPE